MVLMLAMASFLLLSAAPVRPVVGEVKLPLRDYLALVEKVEAAEAARAKASSQAEPSVAELVSQHVSLTLHESSADVVSRFEVEVRGPVSETVALPLTGIASRITIEPPGAAAVRSAPGGLALVATTPGRYRIQVSGTSEVARSEGTERVSLAPMPAAVAEVEVSLPAERAWRCADAVVAEDVVSAGRRTLRLALPRGVPATLELRRDVKAAEPPKAVSAAVVVTIVGLARDTVRRHDVILYEVQRGDLATMAVTLPAGIEPDAVVTDEGEATPWLEGRTLRVERQKKLAGLGYLAIVSQPRSREAIALDPVTLDAKVRARYLAYASDIAASVAPDPSASWARVDLTDLPQPVLQVADALGLVAAWRLRQAEAPGQLRIAALPGPRMLDGVVKERRTTTLLTVEDTLVHRDRFTVEGEGSAFEISLPPNGTVWSAQVNDVPVRPVEQAGGVLIPLGLASSASASTIDVVIVQERSLPPGRSLLELTLPPVQMPVLKHDWRLLLPERNRYRFEKGDLQPVRALEPEKEEGARPDRRHMKKTVAFGFGGTGVILGRIVDPTGAVFVGAAVTLTENNTGRTLRLQTDEDGEFQLRALPSGSYRLEVEAPGFKAAVYNRVRVNSDDTRAYLIRLDIGGITETIAVDQPPPLASAESPRRRSDKEVAEAREVGDYRQELDELKQGLVGGVKPVPVKIPETGKVLSLAGALPPAQVSVSLAVKAPKD